MKKAAIVTCVCAAFVLAVAEPSAIRQDKPDPKATQKGSAEDASFVFSKILPKLRRNSGVPPRLPSYLPDVDRNSEVYATLGSANSSGYGIILGSVPDCEGQNVCLYGSLGGSTAPIKLGKSRGVPVKLQEGIQGRFFDSECFAYCNESYVTWSEDGFYYAIGIKAGKKDELIRIANSAIAAGKKQPQAP